MNVLAEHDGKIYARATIDGPDGFASPFSGALFFFVLNTNFDAHDFKRYFVLHVGAGPAQDQVDAAVRKYALNESADRLI